MLKTQNLVSGYGKTQIVRGIDIEINQGEIVSIIGRNGVGKSTLMKTIIGAVRPMEGKIFFKGKDFTKKRIHDRFAVGISFIAQGHGIFPGLTVEENMKMGLNLQDKKRNLSFDALYEQFPILGVRKSQKAGTLSGGEQAMLSVARALVSAPDVVMLDEPSEGVQPNVVTQIGNILQKCNVDNGVTILLVEQNLRLIQQVSQRCYALDKGRIAGTLCSKELTDNVNIKQYLSV